MDFATEPKTNVCPYCGALEGLEHRGGPRGWSTTCEDCGALWGYDYARDGMPALGWSHSGAEIKQIEEMLIRNEDV